MVDDALMHDVDPARTSSTTLDPGYTAGANFGLMLNIERRDQFVIPNRAGSILMDAMMEPFPHTERGPRFRIWTFVQYK